MHSAITPNPSSLPSQPDNQTNRRRPANVRQVAGSLSRFVLTGIVSFTVGTIGLARNHHSYWNETIFRVQTVDFNMLSHTLPTKLSYALIENQPEELQRTLDSNYSLFGLVVTNPTGERVIAYSGKDSGRRLSWSAALDPKVLQDHPYDVLLDPPPVSPQWHYLSLYDAEHSATDFTNQGRVIGRVYYVRGVPPDFGQDFTRWLSNPFAGSSRFLLYNLTMFSALTVGFTFWISLEYLLAKRRTQIREAAQKEQNLLSQNQTLQLQLQERINEVQFLWQQWEQERLSSGQQAQRLQTRNQQLQQEISQLKKTLTPLSRVTQQTSSQQTELSKVKAEAQKAKQTRLHFAAQVQELNQQLKTYQQELQTAKNQGLAQKKHLQQQIEATERSRVIAQLELQKTQANEQTLQSTINTLEQDLLTQKTLQQNLKRQLELLQGYLQQSQQQAQEFRERAELANDKVETLRNEVEVLKEELPRTDLNQFELLVQDTLKQGLGQREILAHYDTGQGNSNSKFADFVVVLENCFVVIEAKSYKGKIQPIGDVRNSNWICLQGNQRILINSSWGNNPYSQVKSYTDSLLNKVRYLLRRNKSRIPVYGVVVFSSQATVDPNIQNNIGGYFRITTLNQLVASLQEIDTLARKKCKTNLSKQQRVNLLLGKS